MGVKNGPGKNSRARLILIFLIVPPELQAVVIGSKLKTCRAPLYQKNRSIIFAIAAAIVKIIENTPI
jgi:hypothetical protein